MAGSFALVFGSKISNTCVTIYILADWWKNIIDLLIMHSTHE